jgi:hypothetical protein
MADLSSITGVFLNWTKSGIFWVIFSIILLFALILILWWNKRTKLKYNALELISYGNGKTGFNIHKAGVFKTKSTFFGLWDTGNEFVFKVDDGRIIQGASTDHLQDLFGKKGFIVRRKDDDVKILVPVDKILWKVKIQCPKCNYKFIQNTENPLFQIAPGEFRDASVRIVDEATKETQGFMEKYLPYIMLGAVIIFFVISMILATQFFNRTVDKAGEILKQAGENAGNVAPATTAP